MSDSRYCKQMLSQSNDWRGRLRTAQSTPFNTRRPPFCRGFFTTEPVVYAFLIARRRVNG